MTAPGRFHGNGGVMKFDWRFYCGTCSYVSRAVGSERRAGVLGLLHRWLHRHPWGPNRTAAGPREHAGARAGEPVGRLL